MIEIKITGSNQITVNSASTAPVLVLDLPAIIANFATENPSIAITGITAYMEGFRLQYVTEAVEPESKACQVFNNTEFLNNQIILPPNQIINGKQYLTFGGLRMLGKTDKIYINPLALSTGEVCWCDIEWRVFFYCL